MATDEKLSLARAKSQDIPKLRPAVFKVRVDIEPAGLIDYQRNHSTGTKYLQIPLEIRDPAVFAKSGIQQLLLTSYPVRKPNISFQYQSVPNGCTDDELLQILKLHCREELVRELELAESLLERVRGNKFVCRVIDEVAALLEMTDDAVILNDSPPNPFVSQSGSIKLDWGKFLGPLTHEFTGSNQAPELKFLRNDLPNIQAIYGVIEREQMAFGAENLRHWKLGKAGHTDFGDISRALIDCSHQFLQTLTDGAIGSLFDNRSALLRLEKLKHEMIPRSSRAKDLRTKALAQIAEVVVENAPGTERLKLAVEQNIFINRLLYDSIQETLVRGLTTALEQSLGITIKGVAVTFDSKRTFADYCDTRAEIGLTNNPTLAALKINAIVRKYFADQPWFPQARIKYQPKTEILADWQLGPNDESYPGTEEFVKIHSVFEWPLSPIFADMIVITSQVKNALNERNAQGGETRD